MLTYNDPGAWWGWHGWQNQPGPLSVTRLIAAGSLSSELAAVLWLLLEHGRSIIVSSPPQQAGKTTTLTALLSFVRDDAVGYFSRGADEEFDVPPLTAGVPTFLMISELSDHLPIYTWGKPAQRAFALVAQGYALASTLHARDAQETLALLADDAGVDRAHLGSLGVVLSLRLRLHGREPERHACELALITPPRSRLRAHLRRGGRRSRPHRRPYGRGAHAPGCAPRLSRSVGTGGAVRLPRGAPGDQAIPGRKSRLAGRRGRKRG